MAVVCDHSQLGERRGNYSRLISAQVTPRGEDQTHAGDSRHPGHHEVLCPFRMPGPLAFPYNSQSSALGSGVSPDPGTSSLDTEASALQPPSVNASQGSGPSGGPSATPKGLPHGMHSSSGIVIEERTLKHPETEHPNPDPEMLSSP